MIRGTGLYSLVALLIVVVAAGSAEAWDGSRPGPRPNWSSASFEITVDPLSGRVEAAVADPEMDGVLADVSGYFVLPPFPVGFRCEDCGTSCDPTGDTRVLNVDFVMDDTPSPGSGVTGLGLANVALGGSATGYTATLLDVEPFCDGDPAEFDIVVDLVGCQPFSIRFDLDGTLGPCAPPPPFQQASYSEAMTFSDVVTNQVVMTLAWDGTSLWRSDGGGGAGTRLVQYDAAGVFVASYAPGIDFRSVFTRADGAGPLLARGFASAQVRVQTSPGVFGNDVLLVGGPLDPQSSVVYDATRGEFVAMNGGTVTRWDDTGALIGTVALSGFGSLNNEGLYPQNRGVAVASGYYLTYSNGVLSAWDLAGTRVDTTILVGAGTSFDSHFGPSYAQGKVWVVDIGGGTWRGYDVGL